MSFKLFGKLLLVVVVGLVGVRAVTGFIGYLNDPSDFMVASGVVGIMVTLFAAFEFYRWLFKKKETNEKTV